MVQLTIKSRGKPDLNLEFVHKTPGQVTVLEVKQAIAAKLPKLPTTRQRLTLPIPPSSSSPNAKPKPTALTNDHFSLESYGVPYTGGELTLKDLGPQAGWRDVYLLEYAGPLFIHPIMYLLSTRHGLNLSWLGSKLGLASARTAGAFEASSLQNLVLANIIFHFTKRELETLFVHKFSNATMPVRNIPKNCGHYWGLSGVLLAASLYRPAYGAKALQGSLLDQGWWLALWSVVVLYAQTSNFITHLNLRNIRTPAGQPRKYPTGYGFDLITCANYFFEALVWVGLTGMTLDPAFLVFAVVGAGQMALWADKKHKTYKKEHGSKYPRGRYRMIPFIY